MPRPAAAGAPRPAGRESRAAPRDKGGAPAPARARPGCPRCRPAAPAPPPAPGSGPSSIASVTRWTVQPCSFTPAASARAWVCRPGNAGSRLGWMFSMRPCQALDQERRQQPHVAGEADDLDAGRAQRGVDRRLVRGAVAAEAAMVDDRGRDAGRRRERKPGGVGPVGQHQHDLGRDSPASRAARAAPPCWSRGR